MKKFNKIMSLLLVLAMVLGLAACGSKTEAPAAQAPAAEAPAATEAAESVTYVDPYDAFEDYDERSSAIYNDVLGEFLENYEAAKAANTVAERYALMAVAEAKLLGAGVFLPLTSRGGFYAITRTAYGTVSPCLWGNDYARYNNVIVTNELIKAADRDEMAAKYAELKGTGEYLDWAESYLTGKGYTLSDTYSLAYASDPVTWDILATYRSADTEPLVMTNNYLVEYDVENVMQPALAESWDISEDGLTYTFHLRPGMTWVDSQGREIAPIVADDFVAGMNHLLDCATALSELTGGVIVNAAEYMSGDITDFSQVGVKAVDDLTVEYTLCEDIPYFMTMLNYNTFAPLCREYYVAQGGQFGDAYDNTAASYKYGTSPDNIAYSGAYLVSNFTRSNTITYKANPAFWNAENVKCKTVTMLFDDGKDQLKRYNDTLSGVLSGATLTASAIEAAKTAGIFDEYTYVTTTNATTYCGWVNINRAPTATANFNDPSVCVSPKTEEDMVRSRAALYNVHFRRALLQSIDRGAYNAQRVGEALKYTNMVNSYTPGNFVSLPEEATVTIGGQEKTYAAGTFYGAIVQDALTADGVSMKVWDPEADGGLGSSTQFDGWQNVEAAKAELATAVAELAAQGIEVSAENPIYIDLPTWVGNETYKNQSTALKKSVEAATEGLIIVNLTECITGDDWSGANYYPEVGSENNYDLADGSGWGPDWGDPNSYLDTMLPDYMGSMVKSLGVF